MTAQPIVISRSERMERVTFPLSALQQRLLGGFFLFHGLAHAAVGIWAAETGRWWLVASLWELAMVGFVAAGFGALGVAGLRELWRASTMVASIASILLFLLSPHRGFLLGIGIDVSALTLVAFSQSAPACPDTPGRLRHRVRRLSGVVIAWLTLIYVAVVLAIRPWNIQWGTTVAERAMPLPGDQLVPIAHYRIDHGITINSPISAVWPSLIQIGQDRAASSIGGKVLEIVPGQAIVLEGWGAFALIPVNDTVTRMLIRTRGAGAPSLRNVVLSPPGLLVFEPAHLIMERRMLRGIKERAEATRDKTFFVER